MTAPFAYGTAIKARSAAASSAANDADTANADREGFWVGHNYYWPDRDYYYNKWRRAYFSLDRSVPTMADAPSWLRYPAKPQWRVISRSRRR